MRIREVREFEVSLNFFLFPVNPTFFMRLPVGSVVFVSHRLQRVVFSVCKVLGKKYLARQGRFFERTKGLTFPAREEHVTTFAY